MVTSKKSELRDLLKRSRIQRTLYYKYGAIAFEDRALLAVEVFKSGGRLTEKLREESERSGIDVLIELGQTLERLRDVDQSSGDQTRYRLHKAYLFFLACRDRPPTQKELLQYEWKRSVIPTLRGVTPSWSAELLNEKLDKIIDGGGMQTKDRKTLRLQTKGMGLVLLDGDRLRIYRRLFREMTDNGEPPDMPEFIDNAMGDAAVKRKLGNQKHLRQMPVTHFIDVLAAPFDILPYKRWIQSYEANQKILRTKLKNREGLSANKMQGVHDLYDLLFKLGVELEILIEGSQESPGLFKKGEKQDRIRCVFHSAAERLGELPGFCEFWFDDLDAVRCLESSGLLTEVQEGSLVALASAYRRASLGNEIVQIKDLAGEVPSVRLLSDIFDTAHKTREPMIYWRALFIDPELRN